MLKSATTRYIIKVLVGPLLAFLFWNFIELDAARPQVSLMAGLTIWVAYWWLSEVVDLAVTSLLPLVWMPVLGILDMKETALQYMDQVIFLFIGGFILSFAIEKWELHKRIAMGVLSLLGSSPARILLALMLTAFFISMWMSNTATVLMLYPAVLAIIYHIKQESNQNPTALATAFLLGLAYAASIGGMATFVGTPTNLIFVSSYQSYYPDAPPLTFGTWFVRAFPVSILLLLGTFGVLWTLFIRKHPILLLDKTYFRTAYQRLSPFSYEEKSISILFLITILLWFTRVDLDLGFMTLKGWSRYLSQPKWVQESTVAIASALMLFFLPAKKSSPNSPTPSDDFESDGVEAAPYPTLLVWADVKKLPFGVILLFGAGFALAKGFEVSGLSAWVAHHLEGLKEAPLWVVLLGICGIICIISEFASNVASIQLALPILVALQPILGISPLALMIPATLAASLGFMLPVATAPNTIVFSSRMIPVSDMWKAGFWIDLIGIIGISALAYWFG